MVTSNTNRAHPELPHDSLAFSLLGAAHVVGTIESGSALPKALSLFFSQSNPSPQTRGAIQDIAYRTMRQLGLVQTLLRLMTQKTPESPLLRSLLYCSLSLLIPAEDASPLAYEPFTTVNQTVTAASSHPDIAHTKGMVNAVLRRFLREQDALIQTAKKHPEAAWNYPKWWIESLQSAYPQKWKTILLAGNVPPPLTLRVNQRKTTVENYLSLLNEAGMSADQLGPQAIKLEKPVPVQQIPGFTEGLVSVQDASAQLAASLLDLKDGMRVLDACAAPGGKTGHMLEIADIDLIALDNDPSRLPRITENMERLELSAEVIVGDAAKQTWWDGIAFDRILADVPCTASGIVRRHPDIRWLRRKNDTHQLATLSAQILDNLWQMLRPEGKLLFVTCSIWPEESEMQAKAFEARNKAIRLTAPGQLFPVIEPKLNQDGLFYALFQKPV